MKKKKDGLEATVKSLPTTPGVYLFKDGRGQVLYVGKAGNLRSRVSSYFRSRERDPKTAMLKDYASTAHMIGWPAPSDRQAEQARAEWIIPNMFTYYATGQKSLEEAVVWGEGELQRIYKAKA